MVADISTGQDELGWVLPSRDYLVISAATAHDETVAEMWEAVCQYILDRAIEFTEGVELFFVTEMWTYPSDVLRVTERINEHPDYLAHCQLDKSMYGRYRIGIILL